MIIRQTRFRNVILHRPDKTICQTLGKTKELETVQTNKAHPFDATV